MPWNKGAIDVELDGGVNANASEYAVSPPHMLIARNVIYDTPGVPRRAPSARSRAGDMTTGTAVGGHNVGDAEVYGALARGGEACAIGKNGLTRVLRDGENAGAWQHIGDGSYTPAAVPTYPLTSGRWTTTGNETHQATSYIEHGGFKILAYVPLDAAGNQQGLRVQVVGSDGSTTPQDIQVAAAADVAMTDSDPIEIVATGTATAWVVWRRASTTIAVCEITLSATGSTAGSVQNAIFSIDAATSYAACADRDTSNSDFFVIVRLTSGGNWWVYKFEAGSSTANYDTTVPAPAAAKNFTPDIDHVTSGGTDLLLMAVANNTSGNIDVLTMTTALGSPTLTAGVLTPTAGASKACFCCGADGYFFVATGARAGLHAAILNTSHTVVAETEEIKGYNVAARPGELDGRPVWPLQWNNDDAPLGDVVVSPQWNGGSTPGNLFLVPCGRYGNDVNASTFGATSTTKVRSDLTSSTPVAAWSYTADLQGWSQTLRTVVLGVDASACRHVEDSGLTYASGSVLTAYDGRVHREADWITPPVIGTIATTGNGNVMAEEGNWSVRAIHVWIDASGRAHRSAPSPASIFYFLVNHKAEIEVSLPQCTSNVSNLEGWPPDEDPTAFFTEIYLMAPSGSEHHLAFDAAGTSMQPSSTSVTGVLHYGAFDDVSPDTTGAILYTEVGGELPQNPAPPVKDLEIIGDRMWLLEAEDPERLWPSKARAEGIAWEFNAALVKRVSGGDGVAVSQINGNPLLMRRDGLYVIYGDGPNNSGNGGVFSVPRKVDGAPGCITSNTVVKVPMGVVYQSERGFFLLSPALQAVQIGLEVEALISDNFVSATYSERDGRVVFWRDTGGSDECLVWDVRSNKWSTWDHGKATVAAVQLENGDVATFATDGADIIEPRYGTVFAFGAGMVLETAWLRPAGANGRVTWDDLYFTAEQLDSHSLTIAVLFDYDNATVSEPKTWTSAELNDELSGSGSVYTVSKRLQGTQARAIKVRITESENAEAGESVRPISLRVLFKTDGQTKRAQAASTGRK